jgi:hypothetical protein
MGNLDSLIGRSGNRQGTYRLWLSPEDPGRESRTTATITPLLGGKFVRLDYTWEVDDQVQNGSILFGCESNQSRAAAVWIDSWHMGELFMICSGTVSETGVIDVHGSYAAPPGPDWGWRTVIAPGEDGTFRLSMYNIPPGMEGIRAVDVLYRQVPGAVA